MNLHLQQFVAVNDARQARAHAIARDGRAARRADRKANQAAKKLKELRELFNVCVHVEDNQGCCHHCGVVVNGELWAHYRGLHWHGCYYCPVEHA